MSPDTTAALVILAAFGLLLAVAYLRDLRAAQAAYWRGVEAIVRPAPFDDHAVQAMAVAMDTVDAALARVGADGRIERIDIAAECADLRVADDLRDTGWTA